MASDPVLSRDVGNRTSLVDQPVIVILGIVDNPDRLVREAVGWLPSLTLITSQELSRATERD